MRLFKKCVFYWKENGISKSLFRKSMHFKHGTVNTIKYNLLFNFDILNTEIFKCGSGAVKSYILSLGKIICIAKYGFQILPN